MPPAEGAPPTEAESLFAHWLAARECGEERDFEDLCAEHPLQAEALREYLLRWRRLDAVRAQLGLGSSRAERRPAPGGDPSDSGAALEQAGATTDPVSTQVLARLAGRGPAFTRYRLQGEMARGGMGAILRVWDEDLCRHLAMKVILGRIGGAEGDTPTVEPRQVARFLEEAQVTGQLDHPGIVPVHELGLDSEGRVYFTMKLVQGKTLAQVFGELQRGEGNWTQTGVLGLIQRVCEAMSYAHAKGVIHRDLKPANVMVGNFGEVFVMDWGLARVQDRAGRTGIGVHPESGAGELRSELRGATSSSLQTAEGDVMGTPAYMSPEQARGNLQAMGPRSDVYSVGAMLYHLLAGHMPYVRERERIGHRAVLQRVLEGGPTSVELESPKVPAELVAICEKAMARSEQDRYADMIALSADLVAYLEGRVVGAYETGAWAETRKWVRRNKPLALALAAAFLSAVGGGIAFAAKAQEAKRSELRAKEEAQRANSNAEESRRNARLAQEEQLRAESETAKVLRLSDIKVLRELEAQADELLWPPYPDTIPALESWLDRARKLVANLAQHRSTLAEMRELAGPWSDEERARDRQTHPRAPELAQKVAELSGLIAQIEQGLDGEARERADQRVAELEPEVLALEEGVRSRRTWRFGSPEEQWQHAVLVELIEGLEGFSTGLLAEDAVHPEHGWSVPKRLAFARELEVTFGAGGLYTRRWNEALPAIRSAYPGLDLKPQVGLVPIGPDPASGLWEFAHLMTGTPAERGPDGKLILTEEIGVVLVLLPGGTFWMGAQAKDQSARNYDPQAAVDEGPVREVAMSPFLLSKYELTQAQWQAIAGNNPSNFKPPSDLAPTHLHPVERVDWSDAMAFAARTALVLPSEAQWEFAARAGTDTPWWTGADRESLRQQHAINLADQTAGRAGAPWPEIADWPELEDGYSAHAPVGSFAPNPWGLHETLGNVWEWCLDGYYSNAYQGLLPPTDPVGPLPEAASRVMRGGSFDQSSRHARASIRVSNNPDFSVYSLGLRPAARIRF